MTVGELMNLLSDCDEDAEVRIMSQEGYPFENGIKGIAVRFEMRSEDDGCECYAEVGKPHEEDCPASDEQEYEDGLKANDVFIVEGRQERYGDKSAWQVARRW